MAVLLIRADASVQIGTGHIMRCIAIGQDWRDRLKGSVIFAATQIPASLQTRLINEGFTVSLLSCEQAGIVDAHAVVNLALVNEAQALVVDGYQFNEDYLREISNRGFVTMLIDDLAQLQDYPLDYVVNPHPTARASLYTGSRSNLKLLLGSRYMLLRQEFLDRPVADDCYRKPPWQGDGQRILVTLGGSDPVNLTDRVVEALLSLKSQNFHACVVVGAANERLQRLIAQAGSDPRISIVHDVLDMAAYFREADFAISGAGVSTWEMCYFGLPALVIEVADNQQANANYLEGSGVAINLGDARQVDSQDIARAAQRWLDHPQQLQEYRRRATGMVDGRGARRCVNCLALFKSDWTPDARRRTAIAGRVLFREASSEDAALLLEWRNDPLTRQASRQSEPVSAEAHNQWLLDTMANEDRRLLIAEVDDQPVGTIRIDIADSCELSWTIAPSMRQRGIGKKMVEEIVHMLALPMTAVVRKGNLASQKIAQASGFIRVTEDQEWITLTRQPVTPESEFN